MATLDVYKTTDKPASLRKRFVLDIIYDEFLALFTKKNESGKKWANQQMKILTMVLWLEQTYVMNFTDSFDNKAVGGFREKSDGKGAYYPPQF
jgi:hypothetical protein